MKRVGILGGTFDPPHCAHLVMAQQALESASLDKVLFMPAPCPPHKSIKELTPYSLRLEMVKLLVADYPHFEISRMEELRKGPSYTVDLLRLYHQKHDDNVYLIIGADSLKDFASWKNPEEILRLAKLVVFPRSGYTSIPAVVSESSIIMCDAPVIDVSSSEVRQHLAAGLPVEHLLPEPIRDFIADNALYGG